MIVYGVATDVSIAQLFIAGILPGMHAGRASSWGMWGSGRSFNSDKVPPNDLRMTFLQKIRPRGG